MMTLNYHSKYAAASILFIFIEIWFWCFDLLPSVKEFILTSYSQNPKNCLITIFETGQDEDTAILTINKTLTDDIIQEQIAKIKSGLEKEIIGLTLR